MPFNDSDSTAEEIYQERILEHYEEPFHRGKCPRATHRHEDDNPLCGDQIQIELEVQSEGKVNEIFFDGDGCCISQASASMLAEHVRGMTTEQIEKFTAEDMLKLFGARLTPNRQKCCLLAWRVLQSAIFSPIAPESGNGAGKTQSGS